MVTEEARRWGWPEGRASSRGLLLAAEHQSPLDEGGRASGKSAPPAVKWTVSAFQVCLWELGGFRLVVERLLLRPVPSCRTRPMTGGA